MLHTETIYSERCTHSRWKRPVYTHAARGRGAPEMGRPTLEPRDPRERDSYRVNHGLVHVQKDERLYSLRDSPLPDIVNLRVRPAVVAATTMRTLRPQNVRSELESPLVAAALMPRPRTLADVDEENADPGSRSPARGGSLRTTTPLAQWPLAMEPRTRAKQRPPPRRR